MIFRVDKYYFRLDSYNSTNRQLLSRHVREALNVSYFHLCKSVPSDLLRCIAFEYIPITVTQF